MSEETRMIIITSNDDLIEQLAKNHWQKTQLIELDERRPPATLDWKLFTELSQLNDTTDQVYQRILSAPVVHRRKTSKKKSSTSLCAICGDKAIGFNYDVLSCASCKAFFRRNAQHSLERLRCLTGDQKCSVDHSTARKCQRCRLERCLQRGMRKDFIHTDEEKQKKQERLEENRRGQSTVNSEDLSLEDWLEIEKVKSSYTMFFNNEYHQMWQFPDVHDRRSAVASWSNMANLTTLKLIDFFRQVDQFEELNADDRFFLIKWNLFSIYIVHKTTSFNWKTKCFANLSAEEQKKRDEYFRCENDDDEQNDSREEFHGLITSMSMVIDGDSTVIYLLLIILLFANDLPVDAKRGTLKDPLAVYRAQAYFTQVLSNYLKKRHGEDKGNLSLTRLLLTAAKLPRLTEAFQRFFRSQLQSNELLQNITPLMQTVLNII